MTKGKYLKKRKQCRFPFDYVQVLFQISHLESTW